MVEENWKELIENLRVEVESLKGEVSNLRYAINQLYSGDCGLRYLVQSVDYLRRAIENLTNAIKTSKKY